MQNNTKLPPALKPSQYLDRESTYRLLVSTPIIAILLLLRPKADTQFTVPGTVEGRYSVTVSVSIGLQYIAYTVNRKHRDRVCIH